MPRHLKPIPILRVESMSTGQPIYMGEAMTDDFTGELIMPVMAQSEPKALPSAQSILNAQNVAKVNKATSLLQSVGIISVPAGVHAATVATPRPLHLTLKRSDWRRI